MAAKYFEAGVGQAIWDQDADNAFELGHLAATRAQLQIKQFKPSLTIVFVCPKLNIQEVVQGITNVLNSCPLIGTSTAGEIANGFIANGVVVCVLASPHLKVQVGLGRHVSQDYRKAVMDALADAKITEYFTSGHFQHQMLNMTSPRTPGVSPVLLIAFTPGSTNSHYSLSHDIHTMLRQNSTNRIPIFGGSSGDYFQYDKNYQIVNDNVSTDSVALALLETEILFGLGMSHGFSETKNRVLVTRSTGHVVQEFDHRPAAEVYSELLDIPVSRVFAELPTVPSNSFQYNEYPFGSIDVYGNSILHVPERIDKDGSIQFPHLIGNDNVMTLMRKDEKESVKAGLSAYEKAVRHGGLKRPSLVLFLSCALRLQGEGDQEEIKIVRQKTGLPICGFYTYGEKGMLDDGLPVYNNQSVSVLVFSDELNPVASLIHQGKRVQQEFNARLERKESQIKSVSGINQIIQENTDVSRLLNALTQELTVLFPWAHGAFYMLTDETKTYAIAGASDIDLFPSQLNEGEELSGFYHFNLDSNAKRFGVMVLKQKDGAAPEKEDTILAETISKLTASGLYRIELDGRLKIRLQQLDILNQLGHELSKPISARAQSQKILKHIRRVLKLSFASLWLVDRMHRLIAKEAMESESEFYVGNVEKENDERLARWQVDNQQPLFYTPSTREELPIDLVSPFPLGFVSIPIIYKDQLRGILNLFSSRQYKWSMQHERIFENMDFLQSISRQIAIYIENKSLHKHATFYREMHHRVKNNLQNIASILRMQLRRLHRVTAEQALSDSISRIMSIAVVHETLSQGEIGMVDVGRLLGNISRLHESEATPELAITIDVSGPHCMLPSREATSLAVVVNELVQNAVGHGFKERDSGRLFISVELLDGDVIVSVQDDGPGLPEYFDPDRDGNLGLTIIRTLVKDELKGRFEISSRVGTSAKVTFPYPQGYYRIE